MLSLGFLAIAVVDFFLLIWAVKMCIRYRTASLYLATIPLTLLWYDNVTIAIGGLLGEGQPLLAMNYVRFIAHYALLPASIVAVATMTQQAGFKIGQIKIGKINVMIAVFIGIAVYFAWHDLTLFSQATFYPSCFADTLRYTTRIAEYTACSPDADIGAGSSIPPIPAISMSLMMLILGIALWIKKGWKWLALGTAIALPFFGVPYSSTGGIFSNAGEPIITGSIVATAAWLSGWRPGADSNEQSSKQTG